MTTTITIRIAPCEKVASTRGSNENGFRELVQVILEGADHPHAAGTR